MNSAAQATKLPQQTDQVVPVSKKRRRTGYTLSTLAMLFMLFDAYSHLTMPRPVADAFIRLGFPLSLGFGIGILGLVCTALYAIPRTSIIGAILLTGYLGGATAANLRVADPLFETLFPVLFGGMIWAALFLRDQLLRRLVSPRA